MLALKCDNCGRYFDFGNKDDINRITYGHESTDGRVVYSAIKNICPACMAAITKALEDRKKRINPVEDDLK